MQSAQHVFGRFRVVVLDEIHISTGQFGEPTPVVAFKKEAALVAKYFGFDDQQIWDGGWDGNHLSLFTFWIVCMKRAPRLARRCYFTKLIRDALIKSQLGFDTAICYRAPSRGRQRAANEL